MLFYQSHLPLWPMHTSATQYMQMEMEYCLSCFPVTVHNEPEAASCDVLSLCNPVRYLEQIADEGIICVPNIKTRRDMLFGYHENMDRRLWLYVFKSENMFIFINDVSRPLFLYDLTENTIHKNHPLESPEDSIDMVPGRALLSLVFTHISLLLRGRDLPLKLPGITYGKLPLVHLDFNRLLTRGLKSIRSCNAI